MAFGIIVYEKEECLYRMLRKRIRIDFPEAYIRWYPFPSKKDKKDEEELIIDRIIVLYDNRIFRQTDLPSYGGSHIIPLFTEIDNKLKIIEYNEIRTEISLHLSNTDKPVARCPVNMLFPYAYIEDRERYIKENLEYIRLNHNLSIRLDLMAGSRMPQLISGKMACGSLTTLLKKAQNKNLTFSEIPEYLNPGTDGFMTPGRPLNSEDVFDYGVEASKELIRQTHKLCLESDISTGLLVVCEGFRTSELSEIAELADNLIILLPEKHYARNPGIQSDISSFKRMLSPEAKASICFCNELKAGYDYETARV